MPPPPPRETQKEIKYDKDNIEIVPNKPIPLALSDATALHFEIVKELFGYRRENEIAFYLKSTEDFGDDEKDPRWLLRGEREDLPGVEVRFICRNIDELDLLEKSLVIKGTIKSILFDSRATTNKEHKIYVSNCRPIAAETETSDVLSKKPLAKMFEFLSPKKKKGKELH
jgi:hypothetical protein